MPHVPVHLISQAIQCYFTHTSPTPYIGGRILFEVEVYMRNKVVMGSGKSHFKIGIYFDAPPGNTDWWFGRDALYIADMS